MDAAFVAERTDAAELLEPRRPLWIEFGPRPPMRFAVGRSTVAAVERHDLGVDGHEAGDIARLDSRSDDVDAGLPLVDGPPEVERACLGPDPGRTPSGQAPRPRECPVTTAADRPAPSTRRASQPRHRSRRGCPGPRGDPGPPWAQSSRMNVTIMLTWYSAMFPWATVRSRSRTIASTTRTRRSTTCGPRPSARRSVARRGRARHVGTRVWRRDGDAAGSPARPARPRTEAVSRFGLSDPCRSTGEPGWLDEPVRSGMRRRSTRPRSQARGRRHCRTVTKVASGASSSDLPTQVRMMPAPADDPDQECQVDPSSAPYGRPARGRPRWRTSRRITR